MLTDFDKYPLVIQIALCIGAAVAGYFMWSRGKAAPANDASENLKDELAASRAREAFSRMSDALRDGFFRRLYEVKKEVDHELAELENRLRKVEQDTAVLKGDVARLDRQRSRRPGG